MLVYQRVNSWPFYLPIEISDPINMAGELALEKLDSQRPWLEVDETSGKSSTNDENYWWLQIIIIHQPELRPFGDDSPYELWFPVRSQWGRYNLPKLMIANVDNLWYYIDGKSVGNLCLMFQYDNLLIIYNIPGWWCKNHLGKYESQWEGLSHMLWKITNVPNHQPNIITMLMMIMLVWNVDDYW